MLEAFEQAQRIVVDAQKAMEESKEFYLTATRKLCVELLALKGLKEEDSCEVVLKDGKSIKGVFRTEVRSNTATLRFYLYRKDGTLGGTVKAYDFGSGVDLGWEQTGLVSVKKCDPPEVAIEEEE